MKISEQVRDIISSAKNNYVQITEGYKFNQLKVINRINLYINNKYQERNDDAIFWNIINQRITHFSKNIDLDTKDLMPYGIGETNFFQAWILRKKLTKWLEDNEFAITLNDLMEGIATYGSIIWKRTKEKGKVKMEECRLSNLYFDQRAKNIKDVDVVELHYLNENELRDKSNIWKGVSEVLQDIRKNKKDSNNIEIWEFWGFHKEQDNSDPVYKHFYGYNDGENEIILWEEEKDKDKDFPYYDFHIGRYRGRWLRIGVPERLFSLQERANQLVNQNAQSTEIASLLLFKTANGEVVGNVLDQAVNGQIINSEDLEQIGITNTGLRLFIEELNLIEVQADKLCLTPDVISGEQLPSGTPFRSLAVFTNAAKSAFKIYRESIGEKVGYILKKDILPSIIKDWNNQEQLIEVLEDEKDVEMYDKALKRKIAVEAMLSGELVTQEYLDGIDTMIEDNIKRVGRKIKTQKGFFNFDFGIKFNITGESVDKAQQNDAYFNAITMVAQNPAILDTPLFRQYLENNGIAYWKLTPKQQQALQQSQGKIQQVGAKKDSLMASVDTNT